MGLKYRDMGAERGTMTGIPSILIVDDDKDIRELLVECLSGYDFQATAVEDGEVMFKELEAGKFDLIVMDVMLPGEDGLSLCRRLRSPGGPHEKIPVIFVTALGETTDRIVGLELGADDYLAKPFQTRELVARIRAVLRRTSPSPEVSDNDEPTGQADDRLWFFDQWKLNPLARHLIDAQGEVIALSAAEYRLLLFFLSRPGRILSRDQIMEHLAGRSVEAYDRSIDVQISRLRGKLRDNGKNPHIIKTMRGDGYMLSVAVRRGEADEKTS